MQTATRVSICIVFINTAFTVAAQHKLQSVGDSLRRAIIDDDSSDRWMKIKDGIAHDAQTFFIEFGEAFGLSEDDSMHLIQVKHDEIGYIHSKFLQYHKNVKLFGGELLVHQNSSHDIYLVNGNVYDNLEMDVVPLLSPDRVVALALSHLPATTYYWEMDFWEQQIKRHTGNENASYYPVPELMIYPGELLSQTYRSDFLLVYSLEIHAMKPWKEVQILIDANSGFVLKEINLQHNCSTASVETNYYGNQTIGTEFVSGNYRLFNDCLTSEAEFLVRDYNNSPPGQAPPNNPAEILSEDNTWNNTTTQEFGASTMYALQRVDAYFKNVHDRNSYNNNNGDLDVFVNAIYLNNQGDPYTSNAAYHGNGVMTIGIGDPDYGFPFECIDSDPLEDALNTLDIMGHEFGHAVDESEANLTYQGESGALDESFADIYGSMVELNTLGSNDWLMGDERCTGYLRNLADPNDKNHPDTYGGMYWAPTGPDDPDDGGVHTNSGVQNFWFYLLSVGGSGTNDNGWGYDVTGIGTSSAEKISYRSHAQYLMSSSNYSDARHGAIQAAADLYGECSFQQQQVANAWRAVGVGGNIPWFNTLILEDFPPFFYVSGTWHAIDWIVVSNVDINVNDGTTILRAGNTINLNPGFHATASSGMHFNARAMPCSDF